MQEFEGESLFIRVRRRITRTYKSIELMARQKINSPFVRSSYGLKFTSNFDDATFGFYVKANYGFFYWKRLQSINYEFSFLDIGANQGLYAIGAALNPSLVKSYAFEPVSAVAALLERNVSLNDVATKCVVVKRAVSDKCGFAKISLRDNHSGGATIVQDKPGKFNSTEEIETIDASALIKIVEQGNLPLVVKIDVEGHEEVVIRELFKCDFSKQICEIFYEVDERWVNSQSIQNFLEGFGFELTKVGRGAHYDMLAERIKNRRPEVFSADKSYREDSIELTD